MVFKKIFRSHGCLFDFGWRIFLISLGYDVASPAVPTLFLGL